MKNEPKTAKEHTPSLKTIVACAQQARMERPVDKRLVKEYPNGQKVYDYNPADGQPDGERVNEGYRVVPKVKGINQECASRKAETQAADLSKLARYQVYLPCVACTNCVIVRELEHGELVNTAYACRALKRMVERYGTCINGAPGRQGPLVINRDKVLEEIERRKGELVN